MGTVVPVSNREQRTWGRLLVGAMKVLSGGMCKLLPVEENQRASCYLEARVSFPAPMGVGIRLCWSSCRTKRWKTTHTDDIATSPLPLSIIYYSSVSNPANSRPSVPLENDDGIAQTLMYSRRTDSSTGHFIPTISNNGKLDVNRPAAHVIWWRHIFYDRFRKEAHHKATAFVVWKVAAAWNRIIAETRLGAAPSSRLN